jgi:hypothetical protein
LSKQIFVETTTFEEFNANPLEYLTPIQEYADKHKRWIQQQQDKRRWQWIVICGGEVVTGGSSRHTFPSTERLEELGKKHDRIPLAFIEHHPPKVDLLGETCLRASRLRTIIGSGGHLTFTEEKELLEHESSCKEVSCIRFRPSLMG